MEFFSKCIKRDRSQEHSEHEGNGESRQVLAVMGSLCFRVYFIKFMGVMLVNNII